MADNAPKSTTLTIRLPSELKARLASRAQQVGLSISRLVVSTLDAATREPSVAMGNSGMETALKSLGANGHSAEDLIEELLDELNSTPYRPWLDRRPFQRLASSSDATKLGQEFISRLVSGGGSDTSSMQEILVFLPMALVLPEAVPGVVRSFQLIERHLAIAIDEGATNCRIITATATDSVRAEDGCSPIQECVEAFVASRAQAKAKGSVASQRLAVKQASGLPGENSDREFLYPFQVFGDLAVTFTADTSLGAPYNSIVSTNQRDIAYWRFRFEDLWKLASEF